MSTDDASAQRTPWRWVDNTPVREFVRTETGSSVLLWAALWPSSYERFWTTQLTVSLGGKSLGQDLRGWVNTGLMTFFFLVIGLEARRALDIGDLRVRSRTVLPVLAGLAAMATTAGIY